MGLIIKTALASDCDKIIFSDTTANYDANTNPGGWNAPNPVRASLTSLTLEVYKPLETTPSTTHDLLATAPTQDSDGAYNYEYLAADLNASSITSGVWRFRVVADDNGTETIHNHYELLYGEIEQLVNDKFSKFDPNDLGTAEASGCLDMRLVLDSAIAAAKCGNSTRADRIITYLYAHYQDCC